LDIDTIFPEFEPDISSLNELMIKKRDERIRFQLHLGKTEYDQEKHGNLISNKSDLVIEKINSLQSEKEKIKGKLSESQRAIQKFRSDTDEWNEKLLGIKGSEDEPTIGTLNYFKQQINYLDDILPNEIEMQNSARIKVVKEIFSKKKELVAVYALMKSNVDTCCQRKLSNN